MKKTGRIKWLDFIKGFAILAVVLAHSIYFLGGQEEHNLNGLVVILKELLYTFAMPCFFAVSGYLYKPVHTIKDYIILLYKKTSSFVIPYIIFYVFFAFIFDFKNLYTVINFHRMLLHSIGDLWFLYALFIIFIIVGLMDLMHINKILQVSVFFALLLIYICFGNLSNPDSLPAVQHVINIVIFLFGEMIHKYFYLIKKINNTYIISIFTITFICMAIFSFRIPKFDAQFISLYTIIPKILSIICIFKVSSSINNRLYSANKVLHYLTKYGKYTLIIYIMHFVPVLYINKLVYNVPNIYVQIIVTFILSWMISIFICYMSNRFSFINFLFYPRKYINKLVYKTKIGRKLFL